MSRVATAAEERIEIVIHGISCETWEQLAIRCARRLICRLDAGPYYAIPRNVVVELSTTDGSEPVRKVTVMVDFKFTVEGMRGIDDESR